MIDQSKAEPGKSIAPFQVSVAATAIAKFFAAAFPMEDVKQQAEKIAEVLGKSAGKDHVTLTATGIPNGVHVRLNVEEGILKAAPAMGLEPPDGEAGGDAEKKEEPETPLP